MPRRLLQGLIDIFYEYRDYAICPWRHRKLAAFQALFSDHCFPSPQPLSKGEGVPLRALLIKGYIL
jgi:hypothetical protein